MPNQENTVKLTAEISASSNGLISALKQASSAINDTTSTWQDKFKNLKDSTGLISQAVKNLGDMVSKAGAEGGMEHLASGLGEVQSMFNKVQAEVTTFAKTLSELKNQASEIGMPIEEYQAFTTAIDQANVSMEQGSTAIKNMQKSIAAAMNGVPEAQAMFQQLGISIEQLGSNSSMGNFQAIAQAIQAVIPPTDQAKASMDMFGTTIQDVLHVSQEYSNVLAHQSENAFASDKDVQNAISLTAAIGKLGDQISKMTGAEGQAVIANGELGNSYKDLFSYIEAQKQELADLFVSYQRYVEGLKVATTKVTDSEGAIRLFAEHIGSISGDIMSEFESMKRRLGKEDLLPQEIASMDSVKKFQFFATFLQGFRKSVNEEMTAVHAIINQKLDLGAPIDTKELDLALDHLSKLKPAVEGFMGSLYTLGTNGVIIPPGTLDEAKKLYSTILAAQDALGERKETALMENLTVDLRKAEEQLKEFESKVTSIVEKFEKTGEAEFFDINKINDVTLELAGLQERFDELYESADTTKQTLLDMGGVAEEIEKLADKSIKLVDALEDVNYEASKNSLEKLWDSAKKLGTAFRHPIDGTKRLRERLAELGGNSLKACKTGVIEFGKAFVHPINQAKKLKEKIDEIVASTHRAKNGMNSIGGGGGGGGKNLADTLGLSAQNAKQLLGQIAGMGGKMGFLVWAGRTFMNNLSGLIHIFTEAAKHARELQEIMSEDQTYVGQRRERVSGEMVEELKKYAELKKKIDDENKAVDRDSLAKLERDFKARFGLDLKNSAKEFREAFEWANNMKVDAIKSQIQSLEKMNNALENERKTLTSFLYRAWDNKLDISKWAHDMSEATQVDRKRMNIMNEINELREKLRVAQSKNEFSDWQSETGAKNEDEATAKQKEAEKKLNDALKKLKEWEQQITDTDRQKELREIWNKYADAVNAGVSPMRARNVAIQAINEMLQKEHETEQKKHEELVKAMEERTKAYKDAMQNYAQAENAVVEAKKEYAKVQKDLNREARAERIAKRRERLQKRMGEFGFSPFAGFRLDESNSERHARRRNAQIDASISAKMSKAESGGRVHWTPAEKERLKDFQKLQRQDKALEAVQKQMEAANKQQQAADALKNAAKSIESANKGLGEQAKNLGKAVGELIGGMLPKAKKKPNTTDEAREVFSNMGVTLHTKGVTGMEGKHNPSEWGGKLDLLHKDLQDMQKNTYFVK